MPVIPFIRDLKNQTKKKKSKYKEPLTTSQTIYNKQQWKKLRNSYIAEHPLCEECMKKGKITPAEEVHHKIPFLSGSTYQEQINLAYDYNNLMSVCSKCHADLHKELNSQRYSSKL